MLPVCLLGARLKGASLLSQLPPCCPVILHYLWFFFFNFFFPATKSQKKLREDCPNNPSFVDTSFPSLPLATAGEAPEPGTAAAALPAAADAKEQRCCAPAPWHLLRAQVGSSPSVQCCGQGQSPVSGQALTHQSLCWGHLNWGCRSETLAKKTPKHTVGLLLPPPNPGLCFLWLCWPCWGHQVCVSPRGTGTFCTSSSKPPPVSAGRGQRLSAARGLALNIPFLFVLLCPAGAVPEQWCHRLCSACTETTQEKASNPSPHPSVAVLPWAGGFSGASPFSHLLQLQLVGGLCLGTGWDSCLPG